MNTEVDRSVSCDMLVSGCFDSISLT